MHKFVIPEPSKLYSLKPEGLGTPDTESLASYAMRLAEAHCLNVASLINRFIQPLVGDAWKATRSRRGVNKIHEVHKHTVTSAHICIDKWIGMTSETQATVSAISELTKRENLHLLTLLPLKGCVKSDYILRWQRTWCPCCYDAQKRAGKPVHDLLIWSFWDVSVCPCHNQRLWSRCFWCSARQPILGLRSQPGHCIECGLWLGGVHQYSIVTSSQDLRKAAIVGDLIANWSNLSLPKFKNPPTLQRLLSMGYK